MKLEMKKRALMSLVLSAILFSMPVGAFLANSGNQIPVHAEEIEQTEESTETEPSTEATTEETTESGTEESTGDTTEDGTEDSSEEETEEPLVCSCTDTCGQYDYNKDCPVCSQDYKSCAYVKPNVKITINTPSGWYNDSAKVRITVEDTKNTGNFKVQSVEAKVGQNGSWTDITEDMYLEISENCTVYVKITDQNDKIYERSRSIKCFDKTKPTLNAAVSDGLLSVKASDTESGIKAIYVNGYEFTDITNGTLNVRLQQFDAGYQYFTITAMDNAGNNSEVYRTQNPYYTDPEKSDGTEMDPAEQLPVSAKPSDPSSATAQVTEHTKTDTNGNTVSETSQAEQKKQSMAEADAAEKAETADSEKGKEFYTIQTDSEKVFYLIVDRDGDEEKVYFLTEIDENDLLNTTTNNSDTLPKNSAATDSAIPTSEGALSNNNTVSGDSTEEVSTEDATEESTEESTEETPEEPVKAENSMVTYIILGVIAIAVIGGAFYFKVIRKKEDFLDEDDEEDDEEEQYENEDEEENASEDDFFEDTEAEENEEEE